MTDTGKPDGWLARLLRGFGYLTLDPSPRLRRLREESERASQPITWGPLPPLPDSAYPPGAVPLDTSGVPHARPVCPKCGTASCLEDKALDW